MPKYITTRKITGKAVLAPGSVLELTPEQAATPLYRNRVRKADEIVPATPTATASEKDRKASIAAKLKEAGVEFDGRKSADELEALLPK